MAGYETPAWGNNAAPAINAAALLALGQAAELSEHPYGVCGTSASTAAKTVTIDFSGTLSLFTGLTVRIKMTHANTNSAPTLNVNGTGAIPISAIGGKGVPYWYANQIIDFTYDGNSWVAYLPRPVNIVNGFYVGNGQYGNLTPSNIFFADLIPMAVAVYDASYYGLTPRGSTGWENSFLWVTGTTKTMNNGAVIYITTPSGGGSFTWYANSGPTYQLNQSGVQYGWVAVGMSR